MSSVLVESSRERVVRKRKMRGVIVRMLNAYKKAVLFQWGLFNSWHSAKYGADPALAKVNELNARHQESVEAAGTTVWRADAVDRSVGGVKLTDEGARAAIDKRARGQLQNLHVYEGMSALLTFNQDGLVTAFKHYTQS